MTGLNKIISDHFWSVLQEIDALQSDCPIEIFKERFPDGELDNDTLFEVVSFLKKLNYPVNIKKKSGMPWLTITGERKPVMFEMSFSNWVALQAHVPFVSKLEGSALQENLMQFLKNVEARYPHYDLSRAIRPPSNLAIVPVGQQENLAKVNHAVEEKNVVLITIADKKYECFPHRVLYIDGELTFIGEEVKDRCLVSYAFKEINHVANDLDKDYRANFTSFEVDDFVFAIRTVTGNEERLVLKVTAPEKVNLKPEYQFLGSPYITTNTEGDFIWAASVEISNELFEWLAQIKPYVEILDPESVTEQFLDYLENNKYKKAS